jgi:hypothetical protein
VKAAKEAILAIQAELANLVTKEVSVPNHMHNLIIGSGGRLVKSITEVRGLPSNTLPCAAPIHLSQTFWSTCFRFEVLDVFFHNFLTV